MKQITTTKVNLAGNEMTSTSTSVVKNVRSATVPLAAFAVPAGFTKTASPIEKMMGKLGAAK